MNHELLTKLYTYAVDHCVEQGPNADGTNKAWLWEEKFVEGIIKESVNEIRKQSDMSIDDWDRGYEEGTIAEYEQEMKRIGRNYRSYCSHCETDVVICGKCGNNTCNGGYGVVDGVECDQCPSAYREFQSK